MEVGTVKARAFQLRTEEGRLHERRPRKIGSAQVSIRKIKTIEFHAREQRALTSVAMHEVLVGCKYNVEFSLAQDRPFFVIGINQHFCVHL